MNKRKRNLQAKMFQSDKTPDHSTSHAHMSSLAHIFICLLGFDITVPSRSTALVPSTHADAAALILFLLVCRSSENVV